MRPVWDPVTQKINIMFFNFGGQWFRAATATSSFNWNYQWRIQGSKAYQSSGLYSGPLFVFGDMVFVIILVDFFHY